MPKPLSHWHKLAKIIIPCAFHILLFVMLLSRLPHNFNVVAQLSAIDRGVNEDVEGVSVADCIVCKMLVTFTGKKNASNKVLIL